MLCRLCITCVLFSVLIVVDGQITEAQGLFRRIQNRIQSRIPAYQPPLPTQPPQYTPGGQSTPGQPGLEPRRAQPVTPNTRPQPAQPRRATPDPAGKSRTVPNSSASANTNKYGGSILAPVPARAPAQVAKPVVPPSGGGGGLAESKSPALIPAPSPLTDGPSLGIQVLRSEGGLSGLTVTSIGPESLADEAGLKEGDVIVAVDGKPTPTVLDIAKLLASKQSGDRIRARIVRGRATSAIMIPLVGPPDSQTPETSARQRIESSLNPALAQQSTGMLGIKIADSPNLRGVVVTEISENSPADAAGLKPGDRIFSVDGKFLVNAQAFNQEISQRSRGDQLTLQLVRNGGLVAADIELSDGGNVASTTVPANKSAKESGDSVLGGIGSMLGGLLGGKPKAPTKSDNDEMAFGDEEPIAQAGFESEAKSAPSELKDPPSLETLDLPAAQPLELTPPQQTQNAAPPKTVSRVQALQDKIRQLEQELKALEANQ